MFEGIIDQLRPVAAHCGREFERLMAQLANIEASVREGADESVFGDRILRIASTAPDVTPIPLGDNGQVPLDQLWVLDYAWSATAGWSLALGSVPRIGPTNQLIPHAPVLLPGEQWTFVPGGAGAYALQFTRQYLVQRPRPASTGSGAPEGMTSAQGPPVHELDRDALGFHIAAIARR